LSASRTLNDFEVLASPLDLAHVTGHFHAAHHGAGEETLADCARTAMPTFRAVRRVATGKRMAANNTFKATGLW